MSGKLLITISLSIMFCFLLLRRKYYHVPLWQTIPLTVCTAAMGFLGTYILFFLENGFWYGRSFFGAVLFFPILLFPVALIFRVRLTDLLSYATIPGVCLLALYKWNCYLEGCCGGKTLWFSEDGIPTHFPSQIAEMVMAIIIMVLLLILEKKACYRKKIYPICLVTYGISRGILNFFRWEQGKFFLGMAPGVLWSVIAVITGVVWLVVCRKR